MNSETDGKHKLSTLNSSVIVVLEIIYENYVSEIY